MPHGPELTSATAGQLSILAALLLTYLVLMVRRRWAGKAWSSWRTGSFAAGIMLLTVALSPDVSAWGAHDLRGHMVQHVLLGMLAPLALVLGAPGLLLLKSLPRAGARSLLGFLGTRPVRCLVHPGTTLVLDIGAMYLLYLTPLYALCLGNGTAHHLMHLHFLIAGYLFTWSVIGPDPAPHRPGRRIRLLVLFAATATHATLGKLMYAYGFPRGTPHSLEEIQAAAKIMYYGGDLVELLLIVIFFATGSAAGQGFGFRHPAGTALDLGRGAASRL